MLTMTTPEDRRYVTKSSLQEMLDAQSREMKSYFSEQFEARLKPINDEISSLKAELQLKNEAINKLSSEMEVVKSTNDELVAANKSLEDRISTCEKFQSSALESFKVLEEKLEDRTNRQLRQTIVVKGLPEKENEKWSDTRHILAKHVSKAYQIDIKKANALFERVHRGGGEGFESKKKGKRDIYALCSKWDDSEFLVWNSFKANKNKPKKDRVFVEYKYGPLTTLRRGEAMKKRREIIDKKQFKNAYVKFPAILMARKDGEENYSVVQDFSNLSVSKLPLLVGE